MNTSLPSPKHIVMMEDHDKAYQAWKELGVRAGTLVHVDAHIDFGWIPEMDLDEIGSSGGDPCDKAAGQPLLNPFIKTRKKMVHIGNFICPAMRDGLVDTFYWVVPDESWRSRRGIKHIVKHMRQILAVKQYAPGALEFHPDHIRCRVFDKEVIVCGLEGLDRIDKPVLLDIDVDFMLTRSIWDDLNPERAPWIFPDKLCNELAPKINDIEALTVSYSVEGGFTPLRFKYFGDELRMLYGGDVTAAKQRVMDLKRAALPLERDGKYKEAAALYEDAMKIDGTDASLYFNLSILYSNGPAADMEKARSFYRQAVSRDKTYRTRFNNHGILYLHRRDLKHAEEEFRKLSQLDDMSAVALNGLGHVALHKKKYTQARSFFSDCLSIDNSYPEARLGSGITHFKTGALEEARTLLLEIDSSTPGDPEVSWWLGRIAEKKREGLSAIDHYKRSIMLGGEAPAVHLRLSRIYIMKGLYYRAFEELARFFQALKGQFL